jgi:hypothetical protein
MALGEQTMTSPEETKPATGEVAQFLRQVQNASPSILLDTGPESRRWRQPALRTPASYRSAEPTGLVPPSQQRISGPERPADTSPPPLTG